MTGLLGTADGANRCLFRDEESTAEAKAAAVMVEEHDVRYAILPVDRKIYGKYKMPESEHYRLLELSPDVPLKVY